mgnify:CR=1 FL=1
MEVTPLGRVMNFKEEQPLNAPLPMEVTPQGRVMDDKEQQP